MPEQGIDDSDQKTSDQNKPNSGVDLLERTKPKLQKPHMYNVILLNDDFTPMDFVVYVLKKVFHKPQHEAELIMIQIHQKGVGIAGTYNYEIAETKLLKTLELAFHEKHPLQGRLEQCPD